MRLNKSCLKVMAKYIKVSGILLKEIIPQMSHKTSMIFHTMAFQEKWSVCCVNALMVNLVLSLLGGQLLHEVDNSGSSFP